MAPTLVQTLTAELTAAGTLTTPSFTPNPYETILVKGLGGHSLVTLGAPSGGGLTYRAIDSFKLANYCVARSDVAQVGAVSPGAMTVSMVASRDSGTSNYQSSLIVERWADAEVPATPSVNSVKSGTTSQTQNPTLSSTVPDSVISSVVGDWTPVTTGTVAFRSGAVGNYARRTSAVNFWSMTQGATTPGTQTVGTSAPTGQKWTLLAVELVQPKYRTLTRRKEVDVEKTFERDWAACQDDFTTDKLATNFPNRYNGPYVADGYLNIPSRSNNGSGGFFIAAVTAGVVFNGKSAAVQVIDLPAVLDLSSGKAAAEMTVSPASGNRATFQFQVFPNGTRNFRFYDPVVGNYAGPTTVYDPNVHKWIRIQHKNARLLYQYSTDGYKWITLYSTTAEPSWINAANTRVQIQAYRESGAQEGLARFDNFNLEPSRIPAGALPDKNKTLTRRTEKDTRRSLGRSRDRGLTRRSERDYRRSLVKGKDRTLTRRVELGRKRRPTFSHDRLLVVRRERDTRRRPVTGSRDRQFTRRLEVDRRRRPIGQKSSGPAREREGDRTRTLGRSHTFTLGRVREVDRRRSLGRAHSWSPVRRREIDRERLLGRGRTRTTPRRTEKDMRRALGRSHSRTVSRRSEGDRRRALSRAKSRTLARRSERDRVRALARARTRTLARRIELDKRRPVVGQKSFTLRKIRERDRSRGVGRGVVFYVPHRETWEITEPPYYSKTRTLGQVSEASTLELNGERAFHVTRVRTKSTVRKLSRVKVDMLPGVEEHDDPRGLARAKSQVLRRVREVEKRKRPGRSKSSALPRRSVWEIVEPPFYDKTTRLQERRAHSYRHAFTVEKTFTIGHVQERMRYQAPFVGPTLEIVRKDSREHPVTPDWQKSFTLGVVRERCQEWPFGGVKGRRLRKRRTREQLQLLWDTTFPLPRVRETDSTNKLRTRYKDGKLKPGQKGDGLSTGARGGSGLRASGRSDGLKAGGR